MRENPFLGILALILALGMPLSFELFACVTLVANGKVFDAEIHTETELVAALQDPNILQITLKNDIVTVRNLEISRDVILDLGGFNLTSLKANVCVIDIKSGNTMITGRGSIVAYGLKGTAVRIKGATTSDNENYSAVLIDELIKLFAPNHYGLLVAPNFKAAYGVTVDFRGTMVAQDGFCIHNSIHGRGRNIPLITIADHTKITVDENSGIAIHAAGYGRWEIGVSEITGATGIVAQSGNLTLNGTKIIATGDFVEPGDTDAKLTLIGAVIQVGKATTANDEVDITLNSGEFTSLRSYLFAETRRNQSKPALQTFIIESGNFAGKLGTFYGLAPRHAEHAVTVVYGGNFTENVQNYISSSCHVDKARGQNIYHVIEDKVAEEIDEATRLARAEGQLQALIEKASTFVANCNASDLGKWKPVATKAIASIKRATTLGKKALKQHLEYERITAAERSLQNALDNFTLVHDTMRTELAESIASVQAIDAQDYTKYSYEQLIAVAEAAEELLRADNLSLKDLYSAILDIEINIDLLDGIDEVPLEEQNEPAEAPLAEQQEITEPYIPPLAKPIIVPEPITTPESLAALEPTVTPESLTVPEPTFVPESISISEPALIPLPVPTSTPEPTSEELPLELDTLVSSLILTQPESFFDAESEAPAPATIAALEPVYASDSSPDSTPPLSPEKNATYILSHSVEYPAEAALLEAKGNLYSMLEAVQDLTLSDYETNFAEQFGELQVAIVKARATLYRPNATFVELMSAMDELADKTTGLKGLTDLESTETSIVEPPVSSSESTHGSSDSIDWTGLSEVVAEISRLNPDDFTAHSYARVLSQLEVAKAMLVSPNATQSAVEDLVFEINLALLALEYAPQAVAINPVPTTVYTPSPATVQTPTSNTPVSDPATDPAIAPNWIMSMLAGAYAGMATYRRSRLVAKQQKRSAL